MQQATILDRMHIIPSAESAEAPRERKEDVKPGTSNVKVINQSTNNCVPRFLICLIPFTDFLHDIVWNALRNCAGRMRYYVVPKT